MFCSSFRRLAALLPLLAALALPAPAASPQSVYTLDSFPAVGAQTMEHMLDHAAGTLLRASDGNYYGILTSVYRQLQRIQGTSYYTTGYNGEVYRITPGGVRTVLHTFTSPANNGGLDYYGSRACGALVQGKDGLLYGTTYFGGDNALGQVFKMRLSGVTTTLFSFKGGDGFYPQAGLVEGADGNFYGTAAAGGANGKGVVYRISPTGARGVLHSFAGGAFDGASPKSELARGADGNFYGVTPAGGANGKGVAYKITPAGVVTVLHSFGGADGNAPVGGLTFGFDGALYGTTYLGGANDDGVVFKITTGGSYTRLHSFVAFSEGAGPSTRLTRGADGRFYGTTGNGLFVVSSSGGLVKLVTFTGPNGQGVLSGLILGGNGNFFGTTSLGGANGGGTIFESAPVAALTKLYDFPGTDGVTPISLLLGKDGNFYGVTYNNKTGVGDATVFKFTPSTGTLTNLHRFNYMRPNTGLIQGTDGALYGTGLQSGGDGGGAGGVYKITTSGVVTALHDFEGGNDTKHEGALPYAGVIQATDGYFYGTTYGAGLYTGGTIFRMNAAGAILPLHQFALSEGYAPQAALLQASDGNFYGVAGRGGLAENSGDGSVFKITPSGNFTVLHEFDPAVEQIQPLAALVEGKDGALYGSTTFGNYGALFKITKAGVLTTLHNFAYEEGRLPNAPLLLASDGNFYGTIATSAQTTTGGVGGVFKLTPDGSVTIIHSFTGPDGAPAPGTTAREGFPGALIQGKDGFLYGVAPAGGVGGSTSTYYTGFGTIFKLDIGLGPKLPTLLSLAAAPGAVYGGSPITGTVTLGSAAPTGGVIVALSSSNPSAAKVPATVTIAAGKTSATFTITTSPVAANMPVTLTAAFDGASKTAAVNVAPPTLLAVQIAPPGSIKGGGSIGAAVQLSSPPPAGGLLFALSSSNPAVALVPATVKATGTYVFSGKTYYGVAFVVSSKAVTSAKSVTISAARGGVTRSASLTVTP